MFNNQRTLIDMQMDRYRPSIDRQPGLSSMYERYDWGRPIQKVDYYDNICNPHIPSLSKPNIDSHGMIYDKNDHYQMNPTHQVDSDGFLYDPINQHKPLGVLRDETFNNFKQKHFELVKENTFPSLWHKPTEDEDTHYNKFPLY
ncbi:MAG: hypothetical protein KC713_10805 [Candidatus Omnitrophica bacterium]|nr:hypothetical protein [Candidatus Omnitrophota bacterium]